MLITQHKKGVCWFCPFYEWKGKRDETNKKSNGFNCGSGYAYIPVDNAGNGQESFSGI